MTQTAVLTSYSCHSDIKELYKMSQLFAETLKKLRREKGLNQRQLAERLYVTRSSVNRWENGSRLPDAAMLFRLSEVLGVDINLLFAVAAESDSSPNVIMLDDNKIVLNGGLAILEDVIQSQRSGRLPRAAQHQSPHQRGFSDSVSYLCLQRVGDRRERLYAQANHGASRPRSAQEAALSFSVGRR